MSICVIADETVGNLTARVIIDPFGSDCSPREWDNVSTLVSWSRDYNLGDGEENNHGSYFTDDFYGTADLRSRLADNAPIFLPFHSYDTPAGAKIELCPEHADEPHRWTGVAYVSWEKLHAEYGEKVTAENIANAVEIVKHEIATYNSYLQGDVYAWDVVDADGEILESCHGYIGETDYPLSEAIDTAKYINAQRAQREREKAERRANHLAAHLAVLVEA